MNDEIDEHAVAYDFVQLGEALADTLTRAAEEQVQRAQAILDQTKSMADIIRTQVKAQAEQIEEMNGRFKAFGEQMLDAHRKLNGSDERQAEVLNEELCDLIFRKIGAGEIKAKPLGNQAAAVGERNLGVEMGSVLGHD